MTRYRSWWTGLGVVALSSASLVARAEAPGPKVTPVHVLSIDSDDADDQADALTAALRAHVRKAPGYSLLEPSQALGTLLVALKCPPKPDAPCLERIADQIHADHFVWGQMSRKGGRLSVDVHLWTRGKPDSATTQPYPETATDPNDPALIAVADQVFSQVAHVPSAEARAAHEQAAGRTREKAAADQAAHANPGAEAESSATKPSGGSLVRPIIAYSALGVGVLGLGVGIWEGTRFYGARNDLDTARTFVPATVSNVCDSALSAAVTACFDYHHASTVRAEEFVALGVGGALAITGIVLLALPTSHDEKPTAGQTSGATTTWRLAPLVGAHGTTGAFLSGSF